MPSEITLDGVRRQAADIGLTRLNDEHLKELLRATRAARERSAALPTADSPRPTSPRMYIRLSGVPADARTRFLSVAEAAGLLREKKLSPVEYAKALTDRQAQSGAEIGLLDVRIVE